MYFVLAIIEELRKDASAHPEFSYKQGILLHKGRLVLSGQSTLIPQMLYEFHTTTQGGHSGYLSTCRIGAVVYKLKLPEGSRVHPVFHVPVLKKAIGLLLESIKQGEDVLLVLVHWKNRPAEEATWEDAIVITRQFPTFNLDDRVAVAAENTVRDHE
ncbi:hypothetical protein L195_g003615 [Trifolium pratense]|uniref:Tf2-1-like SH3-like domain-containing protein n=1 Tax=Trifolium pratense TaxID=57577 RepID=A0A2K3NVQ6_TRIPR|nr:hypothetical protein L195_g003615 [Trifolium pratense]